jgi:hypothetical protein
MISLPRLVKHVSDCGAAAIVCQVHVALESWFRAELAYLLNTTEKNLEELSFDYRYPGTQGKADIALTAGSDIVVFELKSFVQGADANKIAEFPKQTQRLRNLIEQGRARQAIALATYIGYTESRIRVLLDRSFPQVWQKTTLKPFVHGQPLQFVLAESH